MLLLLNGESQRLLRRNVRAAAAVEEQDADGPVVGDEVLHEHGAVGLIAEDHTRAVEVDDVVVDEVAVAVVDVDARPVARELGVPDFGVVALALNGDTRRV